MATHHENSPRKLPNGRWMEEATGQEGGRVVERILGIRLKSNCRYWLIQFEGYNRLVWVAERGYKCERAIETFLSQMPWDHPPDTPDIEYLHPTLLRHAAPQTSRKPVVAVPKNPPPIAPAMAPKKKVTFKDIDSVVLFSGLEEEAESQDEDEQPQSARKKRSYAEASTAAEPTTSHGGGSKSKPFIIPLKKTSYAQHAVPARSVEELGDVAAAAVPPTQIKQSSAKKTQKAELAMLLDEKDAVSQDERAKKAPKRAYADSLTTPGPSLSGGGKQPMLFNFLPTSALAVKSAPRAKDHDTEAAMPQLKLSIAAAATTNATPAMHSAATATEASPMQPQHPFGFQQGLKLLAILDVRHEAGRALAEVRYDNGAKELVPTALLAQHAAEAKMLNAYYEEQENTMNIFGN
ncbi:hypothetical protein AAVH_08336 [Aphelenchoides avenae]|nr:hypothetical protein AAVH_08336 [Aphelenchus avenae]